MISRRNILRASLGLLAAPALVRVASLMPISAVDVTSQEELVAQWLLRVEQLTQRQVAAMFYGDALMLPRKWFTLTAPILPGLA